MDVDETLIFGADKKNDYHFEGSDHQFEMGPYSFYVKARPGAMQLLNFLSERFELWIYSNGTADYVMKVMDYFFKRGISIDTKKILSREGNCYNKQVAR